MSDCILTSRCKDENGYGYIMFKGEVWRTHRHAFYIAHGWVPIVVMHACDTPACINIEHLIAGTRKLNNKDRMSKGRNGRIDGERHGLSKVKDSEVSEIRDLCESKLFSQREIGEWYGITQSQVSKLFLKQCFKGFTKNSTAADTGSVLHND